MINIRNRRYIGNKASLIDKIVDCVNSSGIGEDYSFLDVFGGTGVVAYHFATLGHPTIVNDFLYCNYVCYRAWFSNESVDEYKLQTIIDEFNQLDYQEIAENYFSVTYGGKYFSQNDAKKIGWIREEIETLRKQKTIQEREYYVLLTSLLYIVDKIANTVGHFESFLKKPPLDKNFQMKLLDIKNISDAQVFNADANALVKEVKADVVYLDPPYNARQYVNFYHVLENLARWNKPTEFEGNSMKFKRNELKSGYSKAHASQLFKELIQSLDAKLIVVSYNNTYNASSTASNNKIQEEEIFDILSQKGQTTKKEIDYKFFNAGKTDFKQHKEMLFICQVKEDN